MTQSMKSLPMSNEIFNEMGSMENEIPANEQWNISRNTAWISNEIIPIMNENAFHSFMVVVEVLPRQLP
jgi:hypothetical protein